MPISDNVPKKKPINDQHIIYPIILLIVLSVAVVFYFSYTLGSSDSSIASDSTENVKNLWGGRWQVVSIDPTEGATETVSLSLLPGDEDLTVDFTDTNITEADGVSYTGCNGGSGSITVKGNKIVAQEVMSTLMACSNDEIGKSLMVWDRWFADLLSEGVTVTSEGEEITLIGDDGSVTLKLIGGISQKPQPS